MTQTMKRPNIVFILSDDHGYWANGCYGNSEVKTPNIDKLAKEGAKFNNFFCVSPVCSPARASILTGKIPSQHGVHDWIAKGSVKQSDYEQLQVSKKRYIASLGNEATEDFLSVPEEDKVPITLTSQYRFITHETGDPMQYLEDQTGYTDILASEGYSCGMIGKWHLGDSKTPQHGMTHWSSIGKGGCIYHLADFYRNGDLEMDDRYITDVITEEGIQFIEEHHEGDQPFYLGLHYTAPHSPWIKEDQPLDIWQSYDACSFDFIEEESVHPWQVQKRHPGYITSEGRRYMLQGYYTAVTAMDKCIGQVMDKLEALNIRDNTLIVFTSDNGMNMGQHGIWGKGNGTFPQNMFDTSVKVPMIVSHPKTIEGSVEVDDLLSHYDIFPTLLDYVNIKKDKVVEGLPGKSFINILRGEKTSDTHDVVVYDEYGPVRMIRSGEWKYVHRYPDGPHELYQMNEDPNEKNNLTGIEIYKDIQDKMRGRLNQWFMQYVNEDLNGVLLPVTGDGQIDKGNIENGKTAFRPRV